MLALPYMPFTSAEQAPSLINVSEVKGSCSLTKLPVFVSGSPVWVFVVMLDT